MENALDRSGAARLMKVDRSETKTNRARGGEGREWNCWP